MLVGAGEGGDPLVLVREVKRDIVAIIGSQIQWSTGGVEWIERGSFILDVVLSE